MKKHPVTLITFLVLLVAIVPIVLFLVDKSYTDYWDDGVIENDVQTSISSATSSATTSTKNSNPHVKLPLLITPKAPAFTVDGFDWSLPADTKVEANSGLIGEYDRDIDYIRNVFTIVRWDEANPQKGQYDFTKLEKNLATITPKKTLIRLEVYSACETPKWALKNLSASDDKSLIFWDKSYLEQVTPFINAFAKRYAADPRIIGIQLSIGDGEYRGDSCDFANKDGWGEFWMSPEVLATAENKHGFSPDAFEKQTKAIVDMYASAFGEHRGKLAFTNFAPSFSWGDIADPYNEKLKLIAQHVWKAGLGNRDGDIEKWLRFVDSTFGVGLLSLEDGTCAMDFNEQYATEIRGRFWGSENEFYGKKAYVMDAYGPYKNQPYRFLISSLRALQMRRNYFSVAGDSMQKMKHPVYKTQDFLRYLTKVMGKQMENTPDAFIILGERYLTQDRANTFAEEKCVKNNKNGVAIRSFGRWIMETSHSTPAVKIAMPANEKYWGQNFYMPSNIAHEFSARKSQQFEFDINDTLTNLRCKNKCQAEVKITFKDTVKTDLTLWYDSQSYQRFLTNGDNKIKTVTFSVNSHFQNKLKGHDFMINSKTDKLSLIMIRVNFL